MIAAGGVFLLVGWLAPMPPAREKPAPAPATAPPGDSGEGRTSREAPHGAGWGSRTEIVSRERDSGDKLMWTMAIVAFVLVGFSQCRSRNVRDFGISLPTVEATEPPVPTTIVESDEGRRAAAADAALATPRESQASIAAHQSNNPWRDVRIEQLVEQGSLRRATMRDYEAWIADGGEAPQRAMIEDPFETASAQARFLLQVYFVEGPVSIPEPLYGPRAVTFLVPRGMPRPTGEAGTPKSST